MQLKIFSLCLKNFPYVIKKFPVFSLSGRSKDQIPCFSCAVATLKWNRTIGVTCILILYLLSGPTSSGMELSLSPLPGRCSLLRDGDSTTSSGMLTSDALVGRSFVVVPLSVTTDASERGDCISVPTIDEYSLNFQQCYNHYVFATVNHINTSSPFPFCELIFITCILGSAFGTYLNWAVFMTTHLRYNNFFCLLIIVNTQNRYSIFSIEL